MRKLALLTFLTLDGVMQSPSGPDEDPSGGFTHGGWARDCWDEVMEQVGAEAMAEPYDLLLGRATYDSFSGNFGDSDENDPVAAKLNGATKYVVTSDAAGLEWANSKAITGDIAAEIAQLKGQNGPLLQVHGSWQLTQTLLGRGLVDELRLWTFPVLVGSGKRLFSPGTPKTGLTLTKSKPTKNGARMSIYNLN